MPFGYGSNSASSFKSYTQQMEAIVAELAAELGDEAEAPHVYGFSPGSGAPPAPNVYGVTPASIAPPPPNVYGVSPAGRATPPPNVYGVTPVSVPTPPPNVYGVTPVTVPPPTPNAYVHPARLAPPPPNAYGFTPGGGAVSAPPLPPPLGSGVAAAPPPNVYGLPSQLEAIASLIPGYDRTPVSRPAPLVPPPLPVAPRVIPPGYSTNMSAPPVQSQEARGDSAISDAFGGMADRKKMRKPVPKGAPAGPKELDKHYTSEKNDPRHRFAQFVNDAVRFLCSEWGRPYPSDYAERLKFLDSLDHSTLYHAFAAKMSAADAALYAKALFTGVAYLNQTDRARYKATVRNGKLYMGKKLLDTSDMSTIFSGEGWAIWVMSPPVGFRKRNKFYTATHEIGVFHHSSFLAGDAVIAGGEWKVKDGVIEMITGKTGHYKTGMPAVAAALQVLQKRDANLARTKVYLWNDDVPVAMPVAEYIRAVDTLVHQAAKNSDPNKRWAAFGPKSTVYHTQKSEAARRLDPSVKPGEKIY